MSTVSDARRAKLIEKHRETNVDYEWWGDTVAGIIRQMNEFGITVLTPGNRSTPAFYFSLHGQGRYVAFDTNWFSPLDVINTRAAVVKDGKAEVSEGDECAVSKRLLKIHDDSLRLVNLSTLIGKRDYIDDVKVRCLSGYRDSLNIETSLRDYYFDRSGSLAAMVESFVSELRGDLKALAEEARALLESEYDYLTSDEVVWESIEANGWDTDDEDEEE